MCTAGRDLRYVRSMKNIPLFLLVSVSLSGAWAQAAERREAPLEQRRTELRSALQTPRPWQAPDKDQAKESMPDNVPAHRRLTEQERSDLRQQLRLQRGESGPGF